MLREVWRDHLILTGYVITHLSNTHQERPSVDESSICIVGREGLNSMVLVLRPRPATAITDRMREQIYPLYGLRSPDFITPPTGDETRYRMHRLFILQVTYAPPVHTLPTDDETRYRMQATVHSQQATITYRYTPNRRRKPFFINSYS